MKESERDREEEREGVESTSACIPIQPDREYSERAGRKNGRKIG